MTRPSLSVAIATINRRHRSSKRQAVQTWWRKEKINKPLEGIKESGRDRTVWNEGWSGVKGEREEGRALRSSATNLLRIFLPNQQKKKKRREKVGVELWTWTRARARARAPGRRCAGRSRNNLKGRGRGRRVRVEIRQIIFSLRAIGN